MINVMVITDTLLGVNILIVDPINQFKIVKVWNTTNES
jgi:hypothetical protein